MSDRKLRQCIEEILREHPSLYARHKRGQAVEGRIVGLVLHRLQGGYNIRDVHIAVVEALATCVPPVVTEPERLNLLILTDTAERADAAPRERLLNLKRWDDSDLADRYRCEQGQRLEETGDGCGHLVLPVLPFLCGREWDNAALNVVRSLRPSSIRVTLGAVTADECLWRVTVWLEPNNRTIKEILQEVEVGLIGCRYASDVATYIAKKRPPFEPTLGIGALREIQERHNLKGVIS